MHVCATCYSDYSSPVMYTTAVAAPSQPDPPMLSEQFVTALTVSWIRRPGDDLFTLHMDDESKVRAANYSAVHVNIPWGSCTLISPRMGSRVSVICYKHHHPLLAIQIGEAGVIRDQEKQFKCQEKLSQISLATFPTFCPPTFIGLRIPLALVSPVGTRNLYRRFQVDLEEDNIIMFVNYSCSHNATTEPTICHAGQHWYNRTQSKYIQPNITQGLARV